MDEFNIRPTHVIEILHVREDGVLQVGIWEMLDRFRQTERYRRREGSSQIQYADLFGRRRTCVRVDQGGYIPGRNRCHFQNERVTPMPQLRLSTEVTKPERIMQLNDFSRSRIKDIYLDFTLTGRFAKKNLHLRMYSYLPHARK